MPLSVNGVLIRCPAIRASPASAAVRPTMIIISVVLPQPLGPRIETNSPLPMPKDTSRSACTASSPVANTFETEHSSISGAPAAGSGMRCARQRVLSARPLNKLSHPLAPAHDAVLLRLQRLNAEHPRHLQRAEHDVVHIGRRSPGNERLLAKELVERQHRAIDLRKILGAVGVQRLKRGAVALLAPAAELLRVGLRVERLQDVEIE